MSLRERGEIALVVAKGGMALVFAKNTKPYKSEVGVAGLCEAFDGRAEVVDEEWHGIQQTAVANPTESDEEELPDSLLRQPLPASRKHPRPINIHRTKHSKLPKKVVFSCIPASGSYLPNHSEGIRPSKKQKVR